MDLKRTIQVALGIYFLGLIGAYFFRGFEWFLWFAVGGGLALVNVLYAFWTIRHGLTSVKSKGIFLGLLMFKSLTFVSVVAIILMMLKPLVLPFTLGLGIVIFASVGAAFWESRRYFKNERS
jgi:hypothetical protein